MSGSSSSPPFALSFFFNEAKGEAANPIWSSDTLQSWQGLKKNKLQSVYTILQSKENMSAQCLSAQGLFLRLVCMRKNPCHVL